MRSDQDQVEKGCDQVKAGQGRAGRAQRHTKAVAGTVQ